MLLATLKAPPPRGSVQSYILQALLLKREQIDYMRTRAIVQALVNKEAGQAAMDLLREVQFPYFKATQQRDREHHIKKLMDEVSKGPLVITPHIEKRVRSRLKTRVLQRTASERADSANRISRKLSQGYL